MEALDPTQFSTWQQVAALAVIVLGGLIAKYIGTLGKDTAAIKATLTANNSGHSVKDALDRIEDRLDALTQRLDAVEAEVVPDDEYEPQHAIEAE